MKEERGVRTNGVVPSKSGGAGLLPHMREKSNVFQGAFHSSCLPAGRTAPQMGGLPCRRLHLKRLLSSPPST